VRVLAGGGGKGARRVAAAGLVFGLAAVLRATVAAPPITEPAVDGQIISPFDVHMVAGPFSGSPGENHVCSDWQIVAVASSETVWSASCVTGTLAIHIHLGDGTFAGALTGLHQLDADRDYRLRVRFEGDGAPAPDWSDWSERLFHTASATAIEPLVLSDVSIVPPPRWLDAAGRDVVLPVAAAMGASLRLEVPGAGLLLQWSSGIDGIRNVVSNPQALAAHGPVRAVATAGAAPLSLPSSRVALTDGSGTDRVLALPPISLASGQTISFWISGIGEAFPDDGSSAMPSLAAAGAVSGAEVPWEVLQPGFRVERVATGFQLPVNIAFVPSPGPNGDDPLYYVTELYGSIKVVTRSGEISTYASGLLNFDPLGSFPGSGEKGLTGIAVEPATGDIFASEVEAVGTVTDVHFPKVIRLHSTDGGHTAGAPMTILEFPTEPLGPSHQTSNVSFGPDGKLYVHIGDGMFTAPAEDKTSVRGKILRANLDGSAPPDNPFYLGDGLLATNLIYALGFRNPFGGAWRAADGAHWEVENGPSVDRLAKVVAGRDYLWDGTDASMKNFAAYNWSIAVAPVNIVFVQASTFGGSGFPADHLDHAFVSESGPTYAPGPQAHGKRISDFTLDAQGTLVAGPVPLLQYVGSGRGTASALAAGPDGLYFSDLYDDFGAVTPVDAGASVFRIRYVGVVDFTVEGPTGSPAAPVLVSFHDASTVPGASAWHWDFGDGTESDEQNPVHSYAFGGQFDVRLTVTGTAGVAARQKASAVAVAEPPRLAPACCAPPTPHPRPLPPR
jgi:glucose/arabinose dehydrogenase